MSLDGGGVVTVQVSEPIMLTTWGHSFAIGPSDYSLFLTVSPDWRKTLLYDHSGQYGCGNDGAIINGNNTSLDGLPVPTTSRSGKETRQPVHCRSETWCESAPCSRESSARSTLWDCLT
jgi:hypothetical protein